MHHAPTTFTTLTVNTLLRFYLLFASKWTLPVTLKKLYFLFQFPSTRKTECLRKKSTLPLYVFKVSESWQSELLYVWFVHTLYGHTDLHEKLLRTKWIYDIVNDIVHNFCANAKNDNALSICDPWNCLVKRIQLLASIWYCRVSFTHK